MGSPGDLIEFDATVKEQAGDKFMFSKGKYISEISTGNKNVRKRKSIIRWWEMVCYRGGLRSYHVRVTRGQIHLKLIHKYARIDPILRFINMLIKINKPIISDILEFVRCEADTCVYALNTYMIYCEYGNPEGMIIYCNNKGKKCRKLLNVNTDLIPVLGNLAIQQKTMMAKPDIKPPVKIGSVAPKFKPTLKPETLQKLQNVTGMLKDHVDMMKKSGLSPNDIKNNNPELSSKLRDLATSLVNDAGKNNISRIHRIS
jgi:hypothetical protein